MAHDAPSIRGYTFSKPPDKASVWWEKAMVKHEISDSTIRKYVKGFKIRFKYQWSNNWLNPTDYTNLLTMYNDESALAFIPRPNSYPSTTYSVQLTNEPEIYYWKDLLEDTGSQAYEATIEGEGLYLTATATDWA